MERISPVYQERSGQGMAEVAEALASPPEFPLAADQLEEVYEFENSFFDCPLQPDQPDVTIGNVLRSSQLEDNAAPLFFAKPLVDGRVCNEDTPAFSNSQEAYHWLAARIESGKSGGLLELARQSLKYYTEDLAAELLAGTPAAQIDPAITECQSLVLDPQVTLKHYEKLMRAKQLIQTTYAAHKAAASNWDVVSDAKCEVLAVYMGKVNDQLALYWPRLGYMQKQAQLTGNDALWLQAAQVLPTWEHQRVLASEDKAQHFYRRLDYVRHGMGHDAAEQPHPVSDRLWQLARSGAPSAPGERRQALESETVEPEDMSALFTKVLRRAGRLSTSDPTADGPDKFYPERRHGASDGGWQVVANPAGNTFMVDSLSRTYRVPQEPQSLYSVLFVGGAHELRHVNQGDGDQAVQSRLKIAGVKGKRVSPLREGGANACQREWSERLIGAAASGPAMTYASAISAMVEGKGVAAAAEAFYHTMLQDTKPAQAAKRAANRVTRLLRCGGSSTQAMAYAEEWLLSDSLAAASPAARKRATEVTCFDLPDQLRLHRYGLLPQPPEQADLMELLLDEIGYPKESINA
jgi:hypothetical protein